ncbi:MAG TPA: hypothetical protein PK637_04785 [Flavobacteriales bacterium]|nr:hypothetical protein [Flavobacteriales bacterium]HRE96058.1 hypothetical protein [Flavobacteriales bacterium]HRJ37980.1 hypothetical protein [Flavobacteriales bacterium]
MKRKNNLVGHCAYCFAPLKGRSHKRFCSLYCKNHYHQTVKEFKREANIPDIEMDFFVLCVAHYKGENKHPLDPFVMSKYDWYDRITVKAREYIWFFGPAYFHIFALRFNPNKKEGIRVTLSQIEFVRKNVNSMKLSDYVAQKVWRNATRE